MKKTKMMGALMAFLLLFTSCSNDDEQDSVSITEMFRVFMFVTNDANEDLINQSADYYRNGHSPNIVGIQEFRFDSWDVYLDGKLIQTDNGNKQFKGVNFGNPVGVNSKFISLDTNCEIQQLIKDWSEKHVVEYKVSSESLFGDTEKHTIRMEFKGIKNTFGNYDGKSEYTIYVDEVQQTVFYPIYWKDLQPVSEYDTMNFPYFILNVDAL